jgi:hypothetical protein
MYPHATVAMSDEQYLVFDAFTDPAYWRARDAAKVRRLVASGAYHEILDGAGIVVLAKGEASRQ